MTSQRISPITSISMSNIKSAVETFLRQTGAIKNSEDIKLLTFGTVADHTTVRDWEAMKIVPLQVILKDEEVDFIKIS